MPSEWHLFRLPYILWRRRQLNQNQQFLQSKGDPLYSCPKRSYSILLIDIEDTKMTVHQWYDSSSKQGYNLIRCWKILRHTVYCTYDSSEKVEIEDSDMIESVFCVRWFFDFFKFLHLQFSLVPPHFTTSVDHPTLQYFWTQKWKMYVSSKCGTKNKYEWT